MLQAKAQFSIRVDGIEPEISATAGSRSARPASAADRQGGRRCDVARSIPPVSVARHHRAEHRRQDRRAKTAGLLPLMAQAGLLIPAAEGSQIPVFKCVFADIGDDQSIAANLSTFSSHIKNIVDMNAALDLPALVLLDEAGAGTDPLEGGALAMAMIDHFRKRGAKVVATTHYDSLKTYAATTEGVDAGRVRLRSADVRADLPPELRIARQQPRARDRDPPRDAGRDHRAGAGAPQRARIAARRAPGARRAGHCRRSSTTAGSRRESARRSPRPAAQAAGARAGVAEPRRNVPASGSTSASTSGCATRGARSTPSSKHSRRRPTQLAFEAERRSRAADSHR